MAETIIYVASIITAITVIVSTCFILHKKINRVEGAAKNSDKIPAIESNMHEMKKDLVKIDGTLNNIIDHLDKLDDRFAGHIEHNNKQTKLMVEEARTTLCRIMEKAINRGYEPLFIKERTADLFAEYTENGGNHGVGELYNRYRSLPEVDPHKDQN